MPAATQVPGSAVVKADEPHSASAIVGDTVTGHHLLQIDGYSRTKEDLPTGEFIESHPFRVGDRTWCIWYYPNGSSSEYAEFISVFLILAEGVAVPFKARAKFSLLDQGGKPVLSQVDATDPREYSLADSGFGFPKWIKREWLEDSEHLKDDCFSIRCDVIILNELRIENRDAAPPFVAVPPSDLNRHLGDLLESQEGADVTFQVAGETFKAHRNILAYRSPVLRAEFFGAMRESTATGGCVHIDDILPQVFENLLRFIYTDSLPEMERQDEAVMAQHLLEAADRYDVQRLKLICEDMLCRHLDVSTAATALLLAEQHNCQGLKKACIEFLKSPDALEEVMATDGFEHLSKSCPYLMMELMSKLVTCSHKRRNLMK